MCRSSSIKFGVNIIIWKLSVVMSPSTWTDLQVGRDSLSLLCPESISNVISRDILGPIFAAAGDIWALRFIYVAPSGLERGLLSRSQKKASIYDICGALLGMMGKASASLFLSASRLLACTSSVL